MTTPHLQKRAIKLTLVSRASPLALAQTHSVCQLIKQQFPESAITVMTVQTLADKWHSVPLSQIGGKGLFVKELEQAVLEGHADAAVHSLKDMPAALPEGLTLAAILPREDPRDAWICPRNHPFTELPAGSRVGTSSLRRVFQLQARRPDLHYEALRGNVHTRLKRCTEGEFAAIVLAYCGLLRLDQAAVMTSLFDTTRMLPAPGQGALAIECRTHDRDTIQILATLDDLSTRRCVTAERAVSKALGGHCHMPVAALGEWVGDALCVKGKVGDPRTGESLFAESTDRIENTSPEQLGIQVAEALLQQGAAPLIAKVRRNH